MHFQIFANPGGAGEGEGFNFCAHRRRKDSEKRASVRTAPQATAIHQVASNAPGAYREDFPLLGNEPLQQRWMAGRPVLGKPASALYASPTSCWFSGTVKRDQWLTYVAQPQKAAAWRFPGNTGGPVQDERRWAHYHNRQQHGGESFRRLQRLCQRKPRPITNPAN